MKKTMKMPRFAAILLLCAIVLAACGGDDDALDEQIDNAVLPNYDNDYPNHPKYDDADGYKADDDANPPITSDTQSVQPTARRMWPVANPYVGRVMPPGFRVEIAHKNSVYLNFFDNLHEFDYSLAREARGHSGDGFYEPAQTQTLIIWSNRPMRDVTVMTLGVIELNGASRVHVPFDSFSIAAEVQVHEGLVINNYTGLGTAGWSGISFVDEYDVRRYFSIHYWPSSGDLRIREFENRSYLWPEGRLPWWTWVQGANDIEPYLFNWSRDYWLNPRRDFDAPCYDRRAELLEQAGISEYGWQVAADFLRGFDSLFTTVGFPRVTWDRESGAARMEGYHAWFGEIDPDVRPEIVFFSSYIADHDVGFFDRDGNQITGVPWLGEWHYANYFSLFDFNSSGIPDILVHYHQTFEGSYGGFYRIFRYIDGKFAALEMTTYFDGEPFHRWLSFNSIHDLFLDETGRIITLLESELVGFEITHLVLTDNRAEFHHLLDWAYFDWYEWQEHHWRLTEDTPFGRILIDDWLANNPTIFGTDIRITPLDPFYDLGAELMAYLQYTR